MPASADSRRRSPRGSCAWSRLLLAGFVVRGVARAGRDANLRQRLVRLLGVGQLVLRQSGSVVAAERLIAVPSRTSRKTKASPVSPMRMRCIARSALSARFMAWQAMRPTFDSMQRRSALYAGSRSLRKARDHDSQPHHSSLVARRGAGRLRQSEHHRRRTDRPDPMADELANAAPVELPPSIAASKTYRCKDNSLVHDRLAVDDKGAYVHGDGQTRRTSSRPSRRRQAGQHGLAQRAASLTGQRERRRRSITCRGKGCKACKAATPNLDNRNGRPAIAGRPFH